MKHTRLILRVIILANLFVINCLLIFPANSQEAELNLTETKVHYTIEVVKQIRWPDEQSLPHFVIGIVGHERGLVEAFEQRKLTRVRGKAFQIERIDDLSILSDRYSIIYIARNKRSLNKQIFSQFNKALIIVDGRVGSQEQLINLVTDRDRVKIKLNRENISQRGFFISANLLDFAGTREDLSDELKHRDSRLKELVAEVGEKEKELGVLDQKLKESTRLLDFEKQKLSKNNLLLEENQAQLTQLEKEIKDSVEEIKKNEQDIANQKKLMAQRLQEVREKESEVAMLQSNIDLNQQVLVQQQVRITKQKKTIESRDETIVEQQGWMKVILFVSLVFFIMIYFLLKTNRLRRKANNELKQLNSKLYELATTDGLTNLYNRRYFFEAAQKELLREKRTHSHSVLMMIDIDHFKNVNDTYGHPLGDQVIRVVADILKASMREYDIVGRLGGEEYAMMLMDCDINQATEIAVRLCKRVSEREIASDSISLRVTVSIGLSPVNIEDTDIEQSIVRADKALYKAKSSGRNRVVTFSDDINHEPVIEKFVYK
ncbi:YfiR/HmsC family protein [Aliikangiella coralliicola]|uniref:diguanylate cyclase n=1 Tax=Aliikangiella coralliicola TaxID=2592383 RepID=A0A545UDS2_9GAMM|nr:YfiR/HmsC family protein [Aliikangiella coralliicola]TQV87608.1 DUF4154 domain-containing protein [Aliikangiella coralliicola]